MMRIASVSFLFANLIAICAARNVGVDQVSSSSSEESSESRRVETACYEKTGSNQTYEAVIASFATIPVCFLMKLDLFKLMDDFARLNASTRHVFFPEYCPQLHNALTCLSNPTKELSKCFNDDIIHLRSINATSQLLDYLCEDNGEILFRDEANYDDCIQNISNYTEECAVLVSPSTKNMAVSKYSVAQCEEFINARNCMQTRFNECGGPRLINVMDVYYRALMKDTPCSNLTDETFGVEDDRSQNEVL